MSKRGTKHAELDEKSEYIPSVSFDTVPLLAGIACENTDEDHNCDDHFLEYTEEEFYDNETSADGWNHSYTPSLSGGKAHSYLIDSKINGLDGFHIGTHGRVARTDYPSRPTIVNEALVLNKSHKNWLPLWRRRKATAESRFRNRNNRFVFPDIILPKDGDVKISSTSGSTPMSKEQRRRALIIGKKVGFPNSPRTIVCHISGRKYTWVGLDWLVKRFAQDVDHLVIIANIPKMSNHQSRSRSRSRSAAPRSKSAARSRRLSGTSETLHRTLSAEAGTDRNQNKHEQWLEWASGYDADHIKQVLKNILNYVVCILPKDRAIKITVEIVIGKTRKILVDSMNVYSPELIVLSTQRAKEGESLVKWRSKSLIDKACQSFPVPIILVPVRKLVELEASVRDGLESQIKKNIAGDNEERPNLHRSKTAPETFDRIDTSTSSLSTPLQEDLDSSSFESEDSYDGSLSPFSTKDAATANTIMTEQLLTIRRNVKSKIRILEKNSSLALDSQLTQKVDVVINSSMRFARLLDEMNQSTESLMDLKRVLSGNSNANETSIRKSMLDVPTSTKGANNKAKLRAPRITFDQDTISAPSTQIKFAPQAKEQDGSSSSGLTPMDRTMSFDATLRPRTSHNCEGSTKEPDLRKVRSAGGLKPTKSASSISSDMKKKSKGFFSFFKGPDSSGNSLSSSRRNSSGSESSGIFLNPPLAKKRSRFFGLKKN
ncbi:LADA_0G07250g1_1 [Lachancea dasiensis]|uniref:LADA_0G07250g1_1 n=1 Tax=Lachancea dasiensis TaxID=1072105 RepID=A0A1G4JTI3_9SACH|nr:LADA_0G07250g1_1 [Lachancea dasiensis]